MSAVGSAAMFTWFSQGVSSLARMGGQVKVAHSLGRGDREEAGKNTPRGRCSWGSCLQ